MSLSNAQREVLMQAVYLKGIFGSSGPWNAFGHLIVERALPIISPSGRASFELYIRTPSQFNNHKTMEPVDASFARQDGLPPSAPSPETEIPYFFVKYLDIDAEILEQRAKLPHARFLQPERWPARLPFILAMRSFPGLRDAYLGNGDQASEQSDAKLISELTLKALLVLSGLYNEVGEQAVQLLRSTCPTQSAVILMIAAGDFWQYRRFERQHMPTDGSQWKTTPKDWSPVFKWLTPDSDAAFKDATTQAHDILIDDGMRFVDVDMQGS